MATDLRGGRAAYHTVALSLCFSSIPRVFPYTVPRAARGSRCYGRYYVENAARPEIRDVTKHVHAQCTREPLGPYARVHAHVMASFSVCP